MRRWLVLLFVVLLPLQFGWSAASAYCQHETGEAQSQHFGHHFHAHQGEATSGSASPWMADADCASCHAVGAVTVAPEDVVQEFATASCSVDAVASPPDTSALARAPDRPQWPRLV